MYMCVCECVSECMCVCVLGTALNALWIISFTLAVHSLK